jgi:hypothetical protein
MAFLGFVKMRESLRTRTYDRIPNWTTLMYSVCIHFWPTNPTSAVLFWPCLVKPVRQQALQPDKNTPEPSALPLSRSSHPVGPAPSIDDFKRFLFELVTRTA